MVAAIILWAALATACTGTTDVPSTSTETSTPLVANITTTAIAGGSTTSTSTAIATSTAGASSTPTGTSATATPVGTAAPSVATPSVTAGGATSMTFTDPFAYCGVVGNIDTPDARYTGAKVPESVARGLMKAVNAPANAPLGQFIEASFWRCMGGKVYACTVGANLPCESKADLSRIPIQPMVDFCRTNPDSEFIPAVATGRTTVFQWRCTAGAPAIVRQVSQPDARGFIASLWHEISPT